MGSIRYAIIIGALFAVLLSAFHVERPRACPDAAKACAEDRGAPMLPLSRLFLEIKERRTAAP